MSRLVFLLEEYSAKVLLDGFLPRLFPNLAFLCVPHEGKQDLEKSIPRKLKAWREPGVRFVILRDNDGADCRELKAKIEALTHVRERSQPLVRIACQEIEAWYLGDVGALATGFGKEPLRGLPEKERFRDPDAVVQPSRAIEELIAEFQKVSGARRMAGMLSREGNRSRSFQVFVDGIARLAAQVTGLRGSRQPDSPS